MRDRPSEKVEAGRIRTGEWQSPATANFGAFECQGPCGRALRIMAYDGLEGGDPAALGWEHVSVSVAGNRPPNWQEMCWVKDQFWGDEETVLQFHPKKSEYVNCHPNCLHLWRNVGLDHPLPAAILVGPKI
jgi:hypothetical protein